MKNLVIPVPWVVTKPFSFSSQLLSLPNEQKSTQGYLYPSHRCQSVEWTPNCLVDSLSRPRFEISAFNRPHLLSAFQSIDFQNHLQNFVERKLQCFKEAKLHCNLNNNFECYNSLSTGHISCVEIERPMRVTQQTH